MAIFGTLDTLPLMDVLPIVSLKKGVLKIALEDLGKLVELYFEHRSLAAIRSAGRYLDSVEGLQELRYLLYCKSGTFWFEFDTEPQTDARLHWPVEQVLFELAKFEDEKGHYAQLLPDPDTVFTLSSVPPSNAEFSLIGHTFYQQAKPLLMRGVSVRQLAEELRISEKFVAFELYKLQQAGVVEPRRAFPHRKLSDSGKFLLKRFWQMLKTPVA
jgi:hypothetical protein